MHEFISWLCGSAAAVTPQTTPKGLDVPWQPLGGVGSSGRDRFSVGSWQERLAPMSILEIRCFLSWQAGDKSYIT